MAQKLYYALHTKDASCGLPAQHIIYGFKTRGDRDAYIARIARERESFKRIKRECGYCSLAIATPWDHAETIPAALVKPMIRAARAKYPDKARYIDLWSTDVAPYSSEPHAAAFLY